ncbi:glycoside hydrolase family 36 protein [Aulographum hederae CBS 113979]|uniref:Glycoside hydrolase family 36 protein n=1 Tax=Aulographum hederae CBS 113979 TaxID=1176131 RepID=A0A6G1GNP6_9PEZI|nr:glycoside hydrolase family 36 protein [Aulographum hederae CBS 113979]
MYAKLVCDPPLDHATVVSKDTDSVTFNILIETVSSAEKQWEVAVWHNHAGPHDWSLAACQEYTDGASILAVSNAVQKETVRRRIFTTELRGRPQQDTPVSFTIKFRAGNDDSWKWVRDHFSVGDGYLYYQPSTRSDDLSYYFKDLNPELKIEKQSSDSPGASLWSVGVPSKAASGKDSGWTDEILGLPRYYTRWFSICRLWTPWICPRHGRGKYDCEKEAMLTAFLRHDGISVVIIALSGVDDISTMIKPGGDGKVSINVRNDRETPGTARVLVAVSESFESANAAAMYHARRIVMAAQSASGENQEEMKALEDSGFKPEWLENWYDGFAYCTWNGIGQALTEQKIFDALDALEKNDIHVSNLIIDDNWQSLDDNGAQPSKRWLEFEANKEGFPNGLKHTVKSLREKHRNIQHVAVWHALLGYWGAVSPHGKIAQDYKTRKVRKTGGVTGSEWTVVDASDAQRFYSDFYSFLSDAGVDSVKTDAQFSIDELLDADDRRAIIPAYQYAWSLAILRHFSAKAISCMSQVPAIMFHSQLPSNKPKILVRNSDDFFPDIPASHPWHVFCNAYNCLFTQHLNALPDWDMFQTQHEWASFHAAARCVSGGPIYFTDKPGEHDIGLIRQMTATTPRGHTVILRPHRVGKASSPFTGYDENRLLKVETYVGFARTGTSILGVFNVAQATLTELIPLSEFPGTETGEYVVRAHTSGDVSLPMSRASKDTLVVLELPKQGWEILSAFPLHRLQRGSRGDVAVANLGLVDKMTGAAGLVSSTVYVEGNGRVRMWMSLKAMGVLGIYISSLPTRSIADDFMALISGRPIGMDCVRKSSQAGNVLEIDLAKAWKESGATPGWSNEITLELFMN